MVIPILRVPVLVLLLISGALLLFQGRILYHPRGYPPGIPLRAGLERIASTTTAGPQVCWWQPPRGGGRWWLCFAGNGSLARGWLDLLDGPDGLLLIEYPGYGESAGSPSPRSILAATEGAVSALRALHPELAAPAGAIGHSLGAAAALQYAAVHPLPRVVLIAPFTRMLDMARLVVGWPFCHLLLDRWDNRARLGEVMASRGTTVDIWHGDRDEVVPVAMGRALAAGFPAIRYHEVVGADHNGILVETAARLRDP